MDEIKYTDTQTPRVSKRRCKKSKSDKKPNLRKTGKLDEIQKTMIINCVCFAHRRTYLV